MPRSLPSQLVTVPREPRELRRDYEAHADFAWRSLHRLGVHERDLPDLLQELFLVVHQRRATYDPARPLRAWIFGICAGLARNYRRRAFRRLETLSGGPLDTPAAEDPEQALDAQRKRRRAERALDALDPEHRAVFVLFEVEGMSGKAIAELLDVPLGTVHSRLHAARRALFAAIEAGGPT